MIIVTGVSGGIGGALVPYLAKQDNVLGIYFKRKPELSKNKNISVERVDLTNEGIVKAFVKKWKNRLEKITVLHFAVKSIDQLAAQYKSSDWDDVMNVNLKANFLLSRELFPLMIQQNWGRIVHISSVVAQNGLPGTLAYAASKSGLLGMSKVLAKEGARFNITSNVLTLGYFDVGLIETVTPAVKQKILGQIPSKKLGHISNIAHAVELLIKSDYINGSVLNIDGGI